MKLLKKVLGFTCLIQLLISTGMAQEYLWPTDASHYLTSSFAEYRPDHFHAGIDIKTWGKIGYKVVAIRDGYITRIGVSPFGYGRVLYQRLDSGELAVYAHLHRFNNELEDFVKKEQKRIGAYRINKNLESDYYPVKKGDFIGYTGKSGIGSPHLHFEIRDSNNNPTNPFLLGYKVEDTISPIVTGISITPLDSDSRVNSDVMPLIDKPLQMSNGNYKLTSKPLVSGNIGFAIECFDLANGVDNKFSVYKLDFYVDEILYFSAHYDKFSYDKTQFVDFDRDFRLLSRGIGRFQKLYKEKLNQLNFYEPPGDQIGVIHCDPSTQDTFIQDRLGRGEHQFFIELSDFFGNVTIVDGSFMVGEQKRIYADYHCDESNRLYFNEFRDQDGNKVDSPEILASSDKGLSWRKMLPQLVESSTDTTFPIRKYLLTPIKSVTLIKIQAIDEYGIGSLPSYFIVGVDSLSTDSTPEINIEKDIYDDFIRFNITVNGLIKNNPQLMVQPTGNPATEVPLWQTRFNDFIGVYQLIPGKDGPLSIEAKATDVDDRELTYWDQFDVQTISPGHGGVMTSNDGQCRIIFDKGSVYKNLFLRINHLSPLHDSNYETVGDVYEIFPQDIPLKQKASIEITYQESDSLPDKLGIYQVGTIKPGFTGNRIDYQNNMIRCYVSNLGAFTLIRDRIAPYVALRYPSDQAMLNQKRPSFFAIVYDDLSGIADERSIIMKLDGEKVIAEYDPEAKTIEYEPDTPLSLGEHVISVRAIDNSKNETLVSHKFYITN